MNTINIMPKNDLKVHFEGSRCWCKPLVRNRNGALFIVHDAMDNRELNGVGRNNILSNLKKADEKLKKKKS